MASKLLTNGSFWFELAVVVALVVTAPIVLRRAATSAPRVTTLRAVHLYYGCLMACMALGHVAAITVRATEGAVSPGLRMALLYAVGLVLLVPSLWIVVTALRLQGVETSSRHLTVPNAALAVVLIAGGPSAPLAIPAVLNLVILRTRRRRVERGAVLLSAVLYAAMFVVSFFVDGAPPGSAP